MTEGLSTGTNTGMQDKEPDIPRPSPEASGRVIRETTEQWDDLLPGAKVVGSAEQNSHEVREDGLGWKMKTKQVGKPNPADPRAAIHWNADMMRLSPNVGKWHPRGVFRFKTWEEFNKWKAEHPLTPNS